MHSLCVFDWPWPLAEEMQQLAFTTHGAANAIRVQFTEAGSTLLIAFLDAREM